MTRRLRIVSWAALVLLVAFVAAQFVPVARTNPPVETEVPAPPEVHAVLRRACYDCHSNETVWPWYSHVAPVSWLVADDVNHGRSHFNFSTWNRLTPNDQAKTLREAWGQIEEGNMPLWYYLPMHSAARLSDADKALLHAWMQPGAGR
jgi:cytochrome c551/c552